MKKVSARSITQLTAGAACNDLTSLASKHTVTPSIEDLIATLREDAPDKAAQLEAAMANIPVGFALVPTLYTRIKQSENAALENEYLPSVRPQFLKFLAATQKQELRALGICEHGIARMARGLDPASVTGERYALSVDHIIERSGSGRLSDARAKDPQRRDAGAETYPVNHFANLILLPQDIHDFKNRLNALQDIGSMKDGQSRWILMLVPVTDEAHHGYVARPQPAGSALGKVTRYGPTLYQQIGDTKKLAVDVTEVMAELQSTTGLEQILAQLETLAWPQLPKLPPPTSQDEGFNKRERQRALDDMRLRQAFSVADLALVQPKGARGKTGVPQAHRTLRSIFNVAVSQDRAAKRRVTRDLRPRLTEVTTALKTAYQRAEAQAIAKPGASSYQDFVQFFRGYKMRHMCLEAGRYPIPEARALLEEYRRIDRAITARAKMPVARSAPAKRIL